MTQGFYLRPVPGINDLDHMAAATERIQIVDDFPAPS